ncbi:MAG: MOSC domain-containing protein [Pseudomonadota bacterium]
MTTISHRTTDELEAGLTHIRQSPPDEGVVRLIVRRPNVDQREVCASATLDLAEGLVGDNWSRRGSSRTSDGAAHPDMQLNIMNARVVELVAGPMDRWPLAGDQIYLDMDLSRDNLPPGTRLQLGSAMIEVTAEPHAGCKKFVARFGRDAMLFVNSGLGKTLCLRGINAKVVQPGEFRVGDVARRITAGQTAASA